MTIQRSLREGPFSAEEKNDSRSGDANSPAAATLSATLAQVKLNTINDMLEAMERPCALLSRWGTIVRLNRLAEALLGQHMTVRRRRLSFADRAARYSYERAVAALLDTQTRTKFQRSDRRRP